MNINDAFPSNYLKATDLQGRNVVVTIASVKIEEVGQGQRKERKLVLAFHGKEKRFVCNKTNAGTIEKLYGSDTEGWVGQPITLTAREVEFQGDMVWAIRVSLQRPVQQQQPAPQRQQYAPPPVQRQAFPANRGQPQSEEEAANLAPAGTKNLDEDVPF